MRAINGVNKTLTTANFGGSTTIDQGRRKAHYRVRGKRDNSVHNVYIASGKTTCSCYLGSECKAIIKAVSSYVKLNKNLHNEVCSYRSDIKSKCDQDVIIFLDEHPLCADHYDVMLSNY